MDWKKTTLNNLCRWKVMPLVLREHHRSKIISNNRKIKRILKSNLVISGAVSNIWRIVSNVAREMVRFRPKDVYGLFLGPNPSILLMDGPLRLDWGNRNSNSLNLPTRHRKQVGSLTAYALFGFFSVCSGNIRLGPVRRGEVAGGRAGMRLSRRSGSRGVITVLSTANHCRYMARPQSAPA